MRRAHAALPIVMALAALLFVAPARAQVVQQTNVAPTAAAEPPSIFTNGYQGMLAGTLVGGSIGYLVGQRHGWDNSKKEWRGVGLGLGIGALAGAGLGLTLGFLDRADVPAGRYIARDLLAGVGFGAVIGVISGGIAALVKGEAKPVLVGTTAGVVAGAGAGIITGIIEGAYKRRHRASATTTTVGSVRIRPSFGADQHGAVSGLVGTF